MISLFPHYLAFCRISSIFFCLTFALSSFFCWPHSSPSLHSSWTGILVFICKTSWDWIWNALHTIQGVWLHCHCFVSMSFQNCSGNYSKREGFFFAHTTEELTRTRTKHRATPDATLFVFCFGDRDLLFDKFPFYFVLPPLTRSTTEGTQEDQIISTPTRIKFVSFPSWEKTQIFAVIFRPYQWFFGSPDCLA